MPENGQASTNGAHPDLVVAHTSDLHIGARTRSGEELWAMRAVIDAALAAGAHALILAGDIFDNNRVPKPIIEHAAQMLADAPLPSVILPGNHDPATPDAIYRLDALSEVPNLQIFGVTADDTVVFPSLDLELWGTPHTAYADMQPLAGIRPRTRRHHIIVAHGHWVRGVHDHHRAWLIHDHEIAASGTDYLALGHWDVPQPAGDGTVPAYYSGSPEHAKSINIVRLSDAGVDVRRQGFKS